MDPHHQHQAHGGEDDPLRQAYGQTLSVGTIGLDVNMCYGVARAGSRQRRRHALNYRNPDSDPQREIEALRAVRRPNKVKLLDA